MSTTVVNFFKSEYDVYIGRAGHGKDGYFGNPYPVWTTSEEARTVSLCKYESYMLDRLRTDQEFKGRLLQLKDRRLACFCVPKRCHGHIMAAWLDRFDTVSKHIAETISDLDKAPWVRDYLLKNT